jgi:hypothetical protein
LILRGFLFLWLMLATSGIAQAIVVSPPDAVQIAIDILKEWKKGTLAERSARLNLLYRPLPLLRPIPLATSDYKVEIASIFYIGALESNITLTLKDSGAKIDYTLAANSIDSLNKFLSYNKDLPEWSATRDNANYYAGETAHVLGDSGTAMRYWSACAAMGSAGCIDRLADAALTKPVVSDADIRQALDLRAKAVESGIHYHCAGQDAAVKMARLVYFTGVKRAGDDAFALLDSAQTLHGQLLVRTKGDDPCESEKIVLDRFMMSADRNETSIDEVERSTTSVVDRQIAGFLRGRISDEQLIQAFANSTEDDRCQTRFYAAWKAERDGKFEDARKHYQALAALPRDDCNDEPLLMQRYLKLPANG